MACFTVPLAEAVIITAVKAIAFRRHTDSVISEGKDSGRVSIREAVGSLQKMLYGGSFLLAIEHVYHGEVTFVPPFLTAMRTAEEIPAMLHEMATVGVGMAVLTTAAWAVMTGVSVLLHRRGTEGLHCAAGAGA